MVKNITVLFTAAIMLSCCSGQRKAEKGLASEIPADSSLDIVDSMARVLLKKGFNAGSGYSQVWARDLNTFIEIALEEVDHAEVRGAMTADWGDVQPNTDNVVDIDSTTTPAIDVYDNAMFIIALRDMAEMVSSGKHMMRSAR